MPTPPTGRPKGRPPKPTEQKRRLGNPGGRPLPEPVVVRLVEPAEQPVPMRPLGAPGAHLWGRAISAGPWLTPADLEVLLMVCEAADERAGLRLSVLRDAGRFDRAALRQLDRQVVNGLSILGFTPEGRHRLGVGEPVVVNPLDELRARRDRDQRKATPS